MSSSYPVSVVVYILFEFLHISFEGIITVKVFVSHLQFRCPLLLLFIGRMLLLSVRVYGMMIRASCADSISLSWIYRSMSYENVCWYWSCLHQNQIKCVIILSDTLYTWNSYWSRVLSSVILSPFVLVNIEIHCCQFIICCV